jgi:HEAT repeat protein
MTTGLPEHTYRDLFGLSKRADVAYADGLISALARIDRGLLPAAAGHPLASHIAQGTVAVERLLERLEGDDLQDRLDAIDALAHVFLHEAPDTSALRRIKVVLNRAGVSEGNEELVALCAKALAIGQDEELLRRQTMLLADDDPGIVATAARLLGFGRFKPAVPLLNALVSPDRFYESRFIIWALGEIGDDGALPILGYALASSFRTVDCMIAMGKIGDISSIPKLTPMVLSGSPEQRDAAYRGLAMIFDANRDFLQTLEHTRREFSNLILTQLSDDGLELPGSTRFHMLLCLARLGEKLDAARVKKFLGVGLNEQEASGIQAFFAKR